MADLSTNESSEVTLADKEGINRLKVNSDGSLNINLQGVPPAPVTATAKTIIGFGDVGSTAGVDTNYTITSGKTLYIQRLSGGSEGETGGSVTELFYDPNGNGVGMQRIEAIYTDMSSYQVGLNFFALGDGTKRVVLRRRGFTNASREMFARWEGYEE